MAGVKVPREPRALRKLHPLRARARRHALRQPEGRRRVRADGDRRRLSTYDEELGKRGKQSPPPACCLAGRAEDPGGAGDHGAARDGEAGGREADDPAEDPAGAGAETVQDTAMNGAQVEALQEVLLAVASGPAAAEAAEADDRGGVPVPR
jgi:hypothetical protein